MDSAKTLRHIGFCPVCVRRIKVRADLLVHHGYERPGFGYIVGDCYGVGRPPHELSPATAEGYARDVVEPQVARSKEIVLHFGEEPYEPAELRFPSRAPVAELHPERYRDWARTPHGQIRYRALAKEALVALRVREEEEGWSPRLGEETRVWSRQDATEKALLEWTRALEQKRREAAATLCHWEKERARVLLLVSAWKLLPLQTVEEEVAEKRALEASREDAKRRSIDKKKVEALANLRERIDSAVKNKNANALRSLFEDGYRKYHELSYRAGGGPLRARDEILHLTDRDEVWSAFGLLQNGEYAKQPDGTKMSYDALYPAHQAYNALWAPWSTKNAPWPEALGGGKTKTPA